MTSSNQLRQAKILGSFGIAVLALLLCIIGSSFFYVDPLNTRAKSELAADNVLPLTFEAVRASMEVPEVTPGVAERKTLPVSEVIDPPVVAEPTVSEEVMEAPQAVTTQQLRLIGLDTFTKSPKFIIQNQATGEQQIVGRNDRVFDSATVVRLVPNGVELRKDNGELTQLFLQNTNKVFEEGSIVRDPFINTP